MSLCPQLCLLAFRALFGNKGPLKGAEMQIFQKSLQIPRNSLIKTPCAKDQVCKSIGVTCSTYRRFTKDKEENYSKMAEKGPSKGQKSKFPKKKNRFLSHVPRSIMSKTVTCGLRTDTQRFDYPIRASAFHASVYDLSGPITSSNLF